MADRRQERAAVVLLIESVRLIRSVELLIHRDDPNDFTDFILFDRTTGKAIWVEVVEAVESGGLSSAERRAQRLKDAAVREYRARGEEVVLTVSPHGVESATPSPGFGVTAIFIPGPPRKIAPPEWIARALERKGRADRYGPAERGRTTLLIDCSREVLIGSDDAAELLVDTGATLLVLPRSLAKRLELAARRSQPVPIAGGQRAEWPVAEVSLSLNGPDVTTPCFIAPEMARVSGRSRCGRSPSPR